MTRIGIVFLILTFFAAIAFAKAIFWLGVGLAWAAVIALIVGFMSMNKTS